MKGKMLGTRLQKIQGRGYSVLHKGTYPYFVPLGKGQFPT
jgi:hypothetical protein